MKQFVERKWPKEGYTIGRLYVNGALVGNTLEREVAIDALATLPGSKKAIKAGTYLIRMKLSSKFGCDMPYLQDVPGRSGIMIHSGNKPSDTQGCILVGQNTKKGMVLKSKATLKPIIQQMKVAEKKGEAIVITIR